MARFLLFGVPVIAFLALGFTFSRAVIRGQDIAVVDMDNSPTSRQFVQTLSASPGITVAVRASDLGEAVRAIKSGAAIAAVYLPPEFGKDLLGGRAPRPVSFVNTQLFTPGSNAGKSLADALKAANTAASPAARATGTQDQPGPGLVAEEYVLANPTLNYAQFLLRAVLPMVLHVVTAACAGFAVGSEFRRRSFRAWWDISGHSVATALVGKLLPYFAVLFLMFGLMIGILDVWLGVSFRGDFAMTVASAAMLLIAYQLVGCLMQLLARNMAVGLSLTGIIVSPAFGYAGVGFPVIGMQTFPRVWGAMLPLRWYMQILFDQATRGAAPSYTGPAFAALCGIATVLGALVWWRFRALVRRGLAFPQEPEAAELVRPRGISGAFAAEWARVLRDRGVLALFVLAPLLYAGFYPQPYLGQIVRNIPIAIVDEDNTELSRALIQALEAHGNIEVALRATTFGEAQEAIYARQAFAIVGIPRETEKNFLKGTTARLPIYADSTYFIVFNRSLQGILETVQAVATDLASRGARAEGATVEAAARLLQPSEPVQVPLFNPTSSYSNYVVPAAFVLILHQTLLMGAASLGGAAYERRGRASRQLGPAALFGRGLAHWTIYIPAMLLYFVVMPRVYGFSTLGRLVEIATLTVPFILATSFLGQTLGLVFRHRETAVLLILASSLPQFFVVGVSWPPEALPEAARHLRELLPSVNAIDGFVRLNQMGATLAEVREDFLRLWVLTALYFALAVGLTARERAHVAVA